MDKRLERITEVLEAWAGGQLIPPMPHDGICHNLRWQFSHILNIMDLVPDAARSWPEYSGDVSYPVPHEHVSPESAYTAPREVPKWGDDAYGQARRRLCQHVADWMRENPEKALSFVRGT